MIGDTARNSALSFSLPSLTYEGNSAHAQSGNTAWLPGRNYHSLYGGYSSLFSGVDDNIYRTYLLYGSPDLWGFGFGAGFEQLASENFSDIDLNLGIGRGFSFGTDMNISIGVKPHLFLVQYTGYDPLDPFFTEYGDSKTTFGLDAALGYKFRSIVLGVRADNIVKPNIALVDTVQAGKLGRSIDAGLSWRYRWIRPSLGVLWDEDDPEENIRFSAALEFLLLDGLLNIVGSYQGDQFNVGLGLNPRIGAGITTNFDYGLTNPNGNLGEADLRHHHIGLGATIAQKEPPIILPELGVRFENAPNEFVPLDEPMELPFDIFRSKVPLEEEVKWRLTIQGPVSASDSGTVLLDDKEIVKRNIRFTPTKRGRYDITVSIDPPPEATDDTLPNIAKISFLSTEELLASVEPSKTKLEIERLTFLSEEEPFVPIIFFADSSADIPNRFDKTLEILKERLSRNPDVVIDLLGFIDANTDEPEDLAMERAQSVFDELVKRGVSPTSIRIGSGHDVTRERVERKSINLSAREMELVSQENRRVELKPMLKGERELIGEWAISSHIDGISGFIQQHRQILCNNPDVTTQFEWQTPEEGSGAYSDISAIRDLAKTLIEAECGREVDIPVIIKQSDKKNISLSLSAEKLIYSPVQYAHSAKDFNIPDLRNPIRVNISDPKAVKSHNLSILNANTGDTLRILSRGSGVPESVILWDWKDDNGILIDPLEEYIVELKLTDVIDDDFHFVSDTMRVEATESIRRLSESIIIQFAFDDVTSTSHYLESRIDYFAQWIMDIAQSSRIQGATIRVMGHTDPIGTKSRNEELSRMRAEKEYMSLRRHLAAILGLPNQELLDEWLGERNIKIEKQGFADTRPYEIEKMTREGQFETFLIGDNNYPEGRSINRRVIILIDERTNVAE